MYLAIWAAASSASARCQRGVSFEEGSSHPLLEFAGILMMRRRRAGSSARLQHGRRCGHWRLVQAVGRVLMSSQHLVVVMVMMEGVIRGAALASRTGSGRDCTVGRWPPRSQGRLGLLLLFVVDGVVVVGMVEIVVKILMVHCVILWRGHGLVDGRLRVVAHHQVVVVAAAAARRCQRGTVQHVVRTGRRWRNYGDNWSFTISGWR